MISSLSVVGNKRIELAQAALCTLLAMTGFLLLMGPVLLFQELVAITAKKPCSISACHLLDGGRFAAVCYWTPATRLNEPPQRYVATLDLREPWLRLHSEQPSPQGWVTATEIPERQMVVVNFIGNLTHVPLGRRRAGHCIPTLFKGLPLNDLRTIDNRFVAALIGSKLSVWDLEERQVHWERTDDNIRCMVVAPTRGCLIACTQDGRVLEFDSRTGAVTREPTRLPFSAQSAAISRDGRRLAVMLSPDGVRILDLASETGVWTDRAPNEPPIPGAGATLGLSPDGELLVMTFNRVANELGVWQISTGQCIQTLQGDGRHFQGAAFGNDRTLLAWSNGGSLHRWDFKRGTRESWTPQDPCAMRWEFPALGQRPNPSRT